MRDRGSTGAQTPAGVLQGGHRQAVRQRVIPGRTAFHRQRRPVGLQNGAPSAAAGRSTFATAAWPRIRRLPVAASPERAGVVLQHVYDRARRQGAGQRDVQRARPPAHAQRAGRQLGDTLRRIAAVRIRRRAHVPRVHHTVPGRRAGGLPGGRTR